MSVEVIYDSEKDTAVLTCNTTDTAFGPVIVSPRESDWSSAELAEAFLMWLPEDARLYGADDLSDHLSRFIDAKPKECGWCRCERPAAAYAFDGTENSAYADGFCSEDCRDAASEDADERRREAYYGASTPQTQAEREARDATEKERLG